MDGSASAKRAFKRSIFLASKCESRLEVVHVVPCEFGGDSTNTFELVAGLKTKGEEILEECKKIAARNNIPIRTISELGDPAKIIIELANIQKTIVLLYKVAISTDQTIVLLYKFCNFF